MSERPNLLAAVAFYVIYAGGLLVFTVVPQADDAAWGRPVLMGAMFGLVAYATYDISNYATLKNWPLGLTLLDMAWGTAISAVSAGAGKAVMNWAARA